MKKKFFTEIEPEFQQDFKEKSLSANSIIISSHTSPDDDSISSVLGVHYYLTEILKIDKSKIRIIYTGEKVNTWEYFKRFSEVEFVDDIYKHIGEDALIIFTDGSGWKRFSRNDEIKNLNNYVVCIDHHPTPEDRFDLHLVATQYPAAAEMVYRLFFEQETLDKEICEIILMGILGDTGNFRYIKPNQSTTLSIAERLIKDGEINVETLQNQYRSISVTVYKSLQELMKNSTIEKLDNWPDFLVSYITAEYIKENNLTDMNVSEASGLFTTYLKSIKGVNWGFIVTPRMLDGACRISLRSIPNSVSVRDMMERMRLGGGHDRASGGKILTADPIEAIKIIKQWMSQNTPVIV